MLTTQQAAQHLNVTRRAILQAIARGKLQASRFGNAWMLTTEEIERYGAARWKRRAGENPAGEEK